MGAKHKANIREVVHFTTQSIGGFVGLVAKCQEFDYSQGRVDRLFLAQGQSQGLLLDVYILCPIVQHYGEPPLKRLKSIHEATIKCELHISLRLLDISAFPQSIGIKIRVFVDFLCF